MKRNRLEKSMAWMLSVGMLLSNAPLVQANQAQTLKNDEIYDDSTVVAERSVSYSKKMESFARNLVAPTSEILSTQNIPGVFAIPGVPEYGTASFWASAVSGGEVEAVEGTTDVAPYTITLTATTGGTVNPTTLETDVNGLLTQEQLDAVEKTADSGYEFKGWYITATGDTAVNLTTGFTADAEIFALWELIDDGSDGNPEETTYTITLTTTTGGTVNPTTLETDENGLLTQEQLDAVEKTADSGYEFKGWYTTATGDTAVNLTTGFTADAEIFALWELIDDGSDGNPEETTYTITLTTTTGGTVNPTTLETDENGLLAQAQLDGVDKTAAQGYTFKGWYTTATGDTAVNLATAFTTDTEIFALWEEDKTGGEGGTDDEGEPEGEAITAGGTYTAGDYYLASDIEGDLTFTGTGDVNFSLNDFKLTGSGDGTVIYLEDVDFTLDGGSNGAGVITGGTGYEASSRSTDLYGGAIYVGTDATLTMESGTISGNTADYGGGVFVGSTGIFTMKGGKISGNEADNGGGVAACLGGTFFMNEGLIVSNKSIANGGGLYIDGDSKGEINGGDIIYNLAWIGGGIAVQGLSSEAQTGLSINGGNISYNEANFAGGINLNGNRAVMTGGSISENNAEKLDNGNAGFGGAVLLINSGELVISGGEITNNNAEATGGAIYIEDNVNWESSVIMEGGTVSGNTAPLAAGIYNGGNPLILNGTLVLTDGVYLEENCIIQLYSDFEIANIADATNAIPISMETPGVFTRNAQEGDLAKFTSFDSDYEVGKVSGSTELALVKASGGNGDGSDGDSSDDDDEITYTITLLTTEGGTVGVTTLTTDGEGYLDLTDLEDVITTPVTGYSFKGWYTTATGTTEVDTSIAFTGDTSIYAQWNWDTKYYINLNANGGTVGATSAAISSPTNGYLTSYSSIPIPKRDGYTFLGWFTIVTDPIESARVSTATLFTEGDTIYAHWDKIAVDDGDGMYTVVFNSNYTWGSTVAKDVEAGEPVSKIPDPVRSGYTLTGWYQDGGGEWNFSNPVTGDMTLVAQWVYGGFYDSYTISFEANDDDGNYYALEAIVGTYGAYVGEPADPTRENYIFLGWYDENGNLFDFCRQIYKDRTLEARWKADGYEVTFDPNFGDEESTIVIVDENTTVSKPTNPTRSGYVFTGWHLDGELFDFDDRIKEDITLVANWSRDGIYDESGVIRYNNQIVVMPFGDASVYPSLPEEGNIVTITPNKNYTVKFIMTVNSTGEEVTLNKYANGSYYFIQPANSVVITVVYQEAFPYLDVYPGDWYYHAVSQLYDNGLLGDSQYYYPDMGAERATVATMLYQIDGSPITNFKDIYPDVSYTDDFAIPVTWASEYAIFVGYEDGLFRPYTAITRQDLALVLSRYAMVKGEDISSGNPTNAYYDNHTISNYALESLNWALEQNIITGVSSSILSPTGDIDKGEFALVMYDFQENILG